MNALFAREAKAFLHLLSGGCRTGGPRREAVHRGAGAHGAGVGLAFNEWSVVESRVEVAAADVGDVGHVAELVGTIGEDDATD